MGQEIYRILSAALWDDFVKSNEFPESRPLLAHYTSIETLSAIVSNKEIWFSNPLFMNDFEELRFGMIEGARAFYDSEGMREACGSGERYIALRNAYDHYFREFEERHAFDTYIVCLSEHAASDVDGRLSMWRGYGGNGKGAAIVFDTSKINYVEQSPLLVGKVAYASTEERKDWIKRKLECLVDNIRQLAIPDDKLYLVAHALFNRIKSFALFSKHIGFDEEREWRIAYTPERDQGDRFKKMLGYAIGRHGVEPKLKMKIEPIDGATVGELSLSTLVNQIILGPSLSSPLAVKAVQRMLEHAGEPGLSCRVRASSTPYRG
ncbi:hypothetical protein WI91_08075 [Burkholderia vietnamiensis]|nr:hypothetical protein WI91_08075 [Burkholderia vietnamiensis]